MPLRFGATARQPSSGWRDMMRVLRIEVLRFWRG